YARAGALDLREHLALGAGMRGVVAHHDGVDPRDARLRLELRAIVARDHDVTDLARLLQRARGVENPRRRHRLPPSEAEQIDAIDLELLQRTLHRAAHHPADARVALD